MRSKTLNDIRVTLEEEKKGRSSPGGNRKEKAMELVRDHSKKISK